MSATPPQQLDGTQSPNQIEFLWERYRRWITTIVAAVLLALGANTGLKFWNQKQVDAKWSQFSATIGLEKAYSDPKATSDSLTESLGSIDLAALEKQLGAAEQEQKPFLLLAVARRAMLDHNWDRAESALAELESKFPKHSLVKTSAYPIQVREVVKKDETDEAADPNKKPEFKPARAGSAVSLMREQIAAAKAYASPPQFARVEIPADATKVKVELSGSHGSFVMALMPQAPKHREAFLKLVAENFWKDINVDEIQRPGVGYQSGLPRQLHIGFESTRDADRTKWTTTEPSKHQVEFETTGLSHFAGAVSARVEADGKSCADRFWIVADDAPRHDGERVVFAYVVEGLEAVKAICEASMSAQEEESGRGKPSENITVVSVTVMQ